jgi:hypothetical protein
MSEFKSRKPNKIKIINSDFSQNDSKSNTIDKQEVNSFNLAIFKNKVIEHLELNLKEDNEQSNKMFDNIKEQSNLNDYNRLYKAFIDNQYNDRLISLINIMISETNGFIDEIRNSFPLHKVIAGIVKKFMLSENELIYFSIYLDKLGWINKDYELETYLHIIAYTVKLYLNLNTSAITYYLQTTNKDFEKIYSNFLKSKESYCESLNITPREVNKKHNELTKPINIYCKQTYLDLNYIVDEVVAMSLPYSETRKEKEKDKIIDDVSVTNFHLKQNKTTDKFEKQPTKLIISHNSSNIKNEDKFLNKKSLLTSNPFVSSTMIENYSNYESLKNNDNNLKDSDKKSFTQYLDNKIIQAKSQNSVLTDLSKLKSENNYINYNSLDPSILMKNLINAKSFENTKSFEQDMTNANNEYPSKVY